MNISRSIINLFESHYLNSSTERLLLDQVVSFASYVLCTIDRSTIRPLHLSSLSGEDIRVTSIQHSHGRASVELSARSSEFDVVTGEVVDVGLGKHGVVLELRLPQWRGISGNNHKLGLSRSEGLEGRFESKGDLS